MTKPRDTISDAIREGAMAYLARQYKTIAIISVILGILITVGINLWTGVAFLLGAFFSALSGYIGGGFDYLVMRFVDVMLCFPSFFLILAVIALLEPSIWNIMIVIGFVGWTGIFRILRGEVLKTKTLDYVLAAEARPTDVAWQTTFAGSSCGLRMECRAEYDGMVRFALRIVETAQSRIIEHGACLHGCVDRPEIQIIDKESHSLP